jgi:hypothetical protein
MWKVCTEAYVSTSEPMYVLRSAMGYCTPTVGATCQEPQTSIQLYWNQCFCIGPIRGLLHSPIMCNGPQKYWVTGQNNDTILMKWVNEHVARLRRTSRRERGVYQWPGVLLWRRLIIPSTKDQQNRWCLRCQMWRLLLKVDSMNFYIFTHTTDTVQSNELFRPASVPARKFSLTSSCLQLHGIDSVCLQSCNSLPMCLLQFWTSLLNFSAIKMAQCFVFPDLASVFWPCICIHIQDVFTESHSDIVILILSNRM